MNKKIWISFLILIALICATGFLPFNKWVKLDDFKTNLVESAEWSVQYYDVDGKILTMMSTPVAIPHSKKLKLSGALIIQSTSTNSEIEIPDLPLTIDLYGGAEFDSPENDINITYQQAKAGATFEGTFEIDGKQTNLFLRIFHYYPGYQVAGKFELHAQPNFLQKIIISLKTNYKLLFVIFAVIVFILFILIVSRIKKINIISRFLCFPELQNEKSPPVKEHFIWTLLAALCLIWMCYLFFLYYHPFKIFVNSDDAWNVLEVEYHSITRDGLAKWTTDRSGAVFIITAQFFAKILRLSKIIPHAYILQIQTALALFIGVVWIGRKSKTFLIFAPLVLMFFIKNQLCIEHDPQSLSFWAWRIGPIPIFLAILAFTSLLKFSYKEEKWISSLLITSLLALISFIQSPGNVVLFGVWSGLLFLRYVVLRRTQYIKWIVASFTFAFTYYLNTIIRTFYDHNIHSGRNSSPMNFNFVEFTNSFHLLLKKINHSGLLDVVIVYIGIAILFISLSIFILRRIKVLQKYMKFINVKSYLASFLLSASGFVYLTLICANRWVQLNSHFIINYAIPAILIFIVAIIWFLQPIILKIPGKVILIIGIILLALATYQTMHLKPKEYSKQYKSAKAVLKYANADKSINNFSLIGDFWTSVVYSWFDPVNLMASGFKRQALTDITLPLALNRDYVLINYNNAPKSFIKHKNNDFLIQNNCVLIKTTNNYNLAKFGWHTYKNCSFDKLALGNNILSNKTSTLFGGAIISNNIFYMKKPGKATSEVIWNLGKLPKGLYMLAISVRYKYEPPASGLLALHLVDKTLNPDYPMIAVKPNNTSYAYKLYKTLLFYPGCNTSTKLRLYSLANKPFEVNSVGIYPVKLIKE